MAYVLYPVYRFFYGLTRMKGFSAAVLIAILLLLLSIPLVFVVGELTGEAYAVYSEAKQLLAGSQPLDVACSASTGFVCRAYGFFSEAAGAYGVDLGKSIVEGLGSFASSVIAAASGLLLDIPRFLLHLFIGIFAMYYMLIQGEEMLLSLKRALPLQEEHTDRILCKFNDLIYATIYGTIIIALVQGVLACLGYFLFGLSSPLLLGLLTFVASFLPFVGAAIVWAPVALSVFVTGLLAGDSSVMLKSAGLALYCLLFVSTIDNVLRPKIVGDRAKIHPLVILLGVFGGLALFGFIGLIVGPLLLTLFVASLKIYEQEKEHIL
jgi:predicted PurR-regulated permease PerM